MHVEYKEAIRKIADGSWGIKADDTDAVEKMLLESGKSCGDIALVELLSCVRKWAWAVVGRERSTDIRIGEKPENAKEFPSVDIGGLLYDFDIDAGASTYAVVGIPDDSGARLVTLTNWEPGDKPWITWATSDMHETLQAAMIEAAEAEVTYNTPRTEAAKKLIEAISANSDISQYTDGIEIE